MAGVLIRRQIEKIVLDWERIQEIGGLPLLQWEDSRKHLRARVVVWVFGEEAERFEYVEGFE